VLKGPPGAAHDPDPRETPLAPVRHTTDAN
jgi:hypothetical protein